MVVEFFHGVLMLVRVISMLFWRMMGFFMFIMGSVLMVREVYFIGLREREVMTFTNVGLRLGMNSYAGLLLVASMMSAGILCLMYTPVRRVIPQA